MGLRSMFVFVLALYLILIEEIEVQWGKLWVMLRMIFVGLCVMILPGAA
jgi:hypothetical protein